MTTRIMIDKCYPDHDRVTRMTDAEVEELAISIRDGGMKHPILVIPAGLDGYIVVDGLARIAAASKLGLTTIEALVTDDLDRACRLIKRVHTQIVPYRRVWEITRALEILFQKRRAETNRLYKEDSNLPRRPTALELMMDALSLPNLQAIKVTRHVYRLAERLGDTEIVSRLDSGEYNLYGAHFHLKRLEAGGNLPPAPEPEPPRKRMSLLSNASRNIGTTIKAISDNSAMAGISTEEKRAVIKELRKQRGALSTIIHKMEKEVPDA